MDQEFPKLSVTNFCDWSREMQFSLQWAAQWIDPERSPSSLTPVERIINARAAAYMARNLDASNSALMNEENRKCFISAWNAIKSFYQPCSAWVLEDAYSKNFDLHYQKNDPIESHLLKIKLQFSRMAEIKNLYVKCTKSE